MLNPRLAIKHMKNQKTHQIVSKGDQFKKVSIQVHIYMADCSQAKLLNLVVFCLLSGSDLIQQKTLTISLNKMIPLNTCFILQNNYYKYLVE